MVTPIIWYFTSQSWLWDAQSRTLKLRCSSRITVVWLCAPPWGGLAVALSQVDGVVWWGTCTSAAAGASLPRSASLIGLPCRGLGHTGELGLLVCGLGWMHTCVSYPEEDMAVCVGSLSTCLMKLHCCWENEVKASWARGMTCRGP